MPATSRSRTQRRLANAKKRLINKRKAEIAMRVVDSDTRSSQRNSNRAQRRGKHVLAFIAYSEQTLNRRKVNYVEHLSVRNEARNQKLAYVLLLQVAKRPIELQVDQFNTKALSLYVKAGFGPVPKSRVSGVADEEAFCNMLSLDLRCDPSRVDDKRCGQKVCMATKSGVGTRQLLHHRLTEFHFEPKNPVQMERSPLMKRVGGQITMRTDDGPKQMTPTQVNNYRIKKAIQDLSATFLQPALWVKEEDKPEEPEEELEEEPEEIYLTVAEKAGILDITATDLKDRDEHMKRTPKSDWQYIVDAYKLVRGDNKTKLFCEQDQQRGKFEQDVDRMTSTELLEALETTGGRVVEKFDPKILFVVAKRASRNSPEY